jgi:hypothetical protein
VVPARRSAGEDLAVYREQDRPCLRSSVAALTARSTGMGSEIPRAWTLADQPEQLVAAGVARVVTWALHASLTRAWAVSPCYPAAPSTAPDSSGCSTVRRCPFHGTRGRVTANVGLVATRSSITAC